MATPQAARHRDLEQRFTDLERSVRELVGRSLRNRQLSVTEGDFVVSGGGRMLVRYGPAAGGGDALAVTPFADGSGANLYMYAQDGSDVFRVSAASAATSTVGARAAYCSLIGTEQATLGNDSVYVSVQPGGVSVAGPLSVSGTSVLMPNLGTTGSAANVNWTAANGLRVNTSSRRFKDNIRSLDLDMAKVLGLEPRTFTRRDDEDNPRRRYVGFIAEEAHDLGLSKWVTYDDDGTPWAFDYSTFCVALQAVCRAQQTQLDEHAQLIADMAARLDALEGKT